VSAAILRTTPGDHRHKCAMQMVRALPVYSARGLSRFALGLFRPRLHLGPQ
jgi:hypothetical protein